MPDKGIDELTGKVKRNARALNTLHLLSIVWIVLVVVGSLATLLT